MPNVDSIRDNILERMFDLEPDEFEHLTKIVIEQTENPADIELTPFGGDDGIDVYGNVGRKAYHARFGVQVKRYENNIGSPSIRNFGGAMEQGNCQFGTFVTTSGYSSGAVDAAKMQNQPITLFTGEEFAELMVEEEIGVETSGDGELVLDGEFWAFGTTTKTDGLVRSGAVPQADDIETIQLVLRAIDDGYRVKPRIREYMIRETGEGWTARQADYYPKAAWALGYLHQDADTEYNGRKMRQWGLTRDGEEYLMYLRANKEQARQDLIKHVRHSDIIERILEHIKSTDHITHRELGDLIEQESELNDTTSHRRKGTVGNWLKQLPGVRRSKDGNSYRYEYLERNLDDY